MCVYISYTFQMGFTFLYCLVNSKFKYSSILNVDVGIRVHILHYKLSTLSSFSLFSSTSTGKDKKS